VLLAVPDLAAGAAWLRERYGLVALPGGRHPGVGTANMLVPLGGEYLELITVVDPVEAAANPLGLVAPALERGARLATWAVRTPDVEASKSRLASLGISTIGPREGARQRPDGMTLRWRTLHLEDGLDPALPFLIEWDVPAGQHPAEQQVEHPAGEVRIARVVLASPGPEELARRLKKLLGEVAFEVVPGERDEVRAVRLRSGDGEVEVA